MSVLKSEIVFYANGSGSEVWQQLANRAPGEGLACPLCGRVFQHKNNFLKHYKTHTGEKPFACIYCSFRTIQKVNLKTHMRNIHNVF
ncbi:hypothetical protein SK128_027459 [Halocaridina rubra]|uniref:C2H2-type domain-containing protein n=1 Tax=Halocaridina rubra TaxID=373956 RepID=A0AAN9ABQ0_HALRR